MPNDHDLGFLLRYENVAWYENGAVRILDRRRYPAETVFVTCRTYGEVAEAIRAMVTQSYGPFQAAGAGMALAAWECRGRDKKEQALFLGRAADALKNARPTTARKMALVTDACLKAAHSALESGCAADAAVQAYVFGMLEEKYARIAKTGRLLAEQVPAGGAVMTQCYADCDLGMLLRALREEGKEATFYVPETRPYLQGARLTASVIHDMGFRAVVITDNMPAYTLQQKRVDVFTTAADVITLDGHVINKVGTFQIAIAAAYLGVPYYCTGTPDAAYPTADAVRIEERDPAEVLSAMGVRTAMMGVDGFYPAFDITPPKLVTGIVTDRGIYPPEQIGAYLAP